MADGSLADHREGIVVRVDRHRIEFFEREKLELRSLHRAIDPSSDIGFADPANLH